MGKLISIVGNLGAGKTTLTRLLCEGRPFCPYWESPEQRPFAFSFTGDHHRWALANQMDFFLFRCQQELTARQIDEIAIMDGGFDQDFYVFTRHIYSKGYLTPDEYKVCEHYYQFTRSLLPPPELIIQVIVDIQTLLDRRFARGRTTIDESFSIQELTDLELFLDEWLRNQHSSPVISLPFTRDIRDCPGKIDRLLQEINKLL